MMNDLLVMTQIAGRRCALRALDVQSVIELATVIPVPRTADYIAGMTTMRSQALTVIDCRKALGFEAGDYPTDDRAAVVAIGGYSYALLVDAIEDVTTGVAEPETISGGFGPEWSRVATHMIETSIGPAVLIDLAALIEGPEGAQSDFGAAA
jgi:purine-binding chemotaxis protein CheW